MAQKSVVFERTIFRVCLCVCVCQVWRDSDRGTRSDRTCLRARSIRLGVGIRERTHNSNLSLILITALEAIGRVGARARFAWGSASGLTTSPPYILSFYIFVFSLHVSVLMVLVNHRATQVFSILNEALYLRTTETINTLILLSRRLLGEIISVLILF